MNSRNDSYKKDHYLKRNNQSNANVIAPKKNLGQHYLIDTNKLSYIASFANQLSESIIEIGPGTGQLTKYLFEYGCKKLLAIEKDKRFIVHLNSLFSNQDFTIFNKDILNTNFDELPNYILVGNLPYNISAPIIIKFINFINKFEHGIFLIQKEVADKICAKCNDRSYGRISVFIQSVANTKKILTVPPGCFSPPPKVYSEVIYITKKNKGNIHANNEHIDQSNKDKNNEKIDLGKVDTENIDLEKLDIILKAAFSNPRKTIRNNLKGFPKAEEIIQNNGLDMSVRPNNIPVEIYIQLSKIIC
ncbi:16S rRNA (adenine(1518)-N(6)/adenine(1519)-N(6))-dimethyltransferase RsmA [Candidatus Cytomitobacter primus]|uniref:Ribosomal RNA small subunit methyltransferase A n=1 Tax=Candidatus Cytomitobacter primus TaxID=2066024 RepID=A0A5C0UFD9_9PROT|nr:16S rRNA (adenine(1518)-N(6)/adenine(1519)-N(6))-dimethyltransferase RsmA [Candidatus Cytomitobacter primus]QEK38499.1 ribosomal RNA small subunit methyltransferase A [Candidatus Cytomitobacter primus]